MGLGDRVAVMHQGKVRQLGTPQEVYHEPADTFVAGFLGSPPMNLVARQDVIVGFRPENFLPKEVYEAQGNLTTFQFKVTRVEYLGADRLLYGVLGRDFSDAHVVADLPSTVTVPIHEGETYEFAVLEKDLKLFDQQTGLRTAPRPL
jgi:multiple sugar transport system ATP-binding protein